MPRRQRLIKERARRLRDELEAAPRTNQKKRRTALKNAFQGHVRDIARAYTEVAMAEIIKIATKSKSENMRLIANGVILERGWGKPAQAVIGGEPDDNPISHVHKVETVIIDKRGEK